MRESNDHLYPSNVFRDVYRDSNLSRGMGGPENAIPFDEPPPAPAPKAKARKQNFVPNSPPRVDSIGRESMSANNSSPTSNTGPKEERKDENVADTNGNDIEQHHQNGKNSSTIESNSNLVSMLRESANHVEKGEFHPVLYQALGALNDYVKEKTGSNTQKPTPSTDGDNSKSFSPKLGGVGKKFSKENPLQNMNLGNLNLGSIGKKFFNHSNGTSNSGTSFRRNSNSNRHQEGDNPNLHEEHMQGGERLERQNQDPPLQMRPAHNQNSHGLQGNKEAIPHATSGMTQSSNINQQNKFKPGGFANKPAFQRPINPNSNLIANGWISQQRRSKMRIVWKDVLASLVDGRKPGEETTLWIQRQVTSSNGRAELEALHQIPMKWLEDVTYVDVYGDFRFTLKVFNVSDEFQFRCSDSESAQNWVVTLRSARDAAKSGGAAPKSKSTNVPPATSNHQQRQHHPQQQQNQQVSSQEPVNNRTRSSHSPPSQPQNTRPTPSQNIPPKDVKTLSVKELKAIAHGAGVCKCFFVFFSAFPKYMLAHVFPNFYYLF